MKKRRVFIAINLPQEVKRRLFEFSEKHSDLPVRWTKEDGLHITLLFVGYVSDEETVKICKIAKDVVLKHSPFEINLTKIDYDSERKSPRMIWAFGKESWEFAELENSIKAALAESGIGFDDRHRDSLIHITLGRITQSELGTAGKPNIAENLNFAFSVESVEVMEGAMTKKGREYVALESVHLRQKAINDAI